MKAYLEGLTATHSGDHVYRASNVLVGRDDRGKVFSEGIASVHTHPSRGQSEGAVRQSRIYHPYRRASQRGEPCHPELPIRALHPAGIPSAVPCEVPSRVVL